jgi:hypothetical protein
MDFEKWLFTFSAERSAVLVGSAGNSYTGGGLVIPK